MCLCQRDTTHDEGDEYIVKLRCIEASETGVTVREKEKDGHSGGRGHQVGRLSSKGGECQQVVSEIFEEHVDEGETDPE